MKIQYSLKLLLVVQHIFNNTIDCNDGYTVLLIAGMCFICQASDILFSGHFYW